MIECGVSWNTIKKSLNYDISNLLCCLVSHIHSDHSKSILDLLKSGIDVYSTAEVKEKHPLVTALKPKERIQIGDFYITPLPVPHSCECYAFLIYHNEFGKLIFATDCSNFKYRIPNINHILIEANYSEDLVINNMCEGFNTRSLYDNHLEINNSIKSLKANFNSGLQNIVLLHLSDNNSDEKDFIKITKKELAFENVFSASKGLEINILKDEF